MPIVNQTRKYQFLLLLRRFSTFPEHLDKRYIVSTYSNEGIRGKKGLLLDYGKGVKVFDIEGNKFLDFSAGIAVSVLGHGNIKIQEAVTAQMKKITHTSNIFHNQPSLNVAKLLIQLSPGFDKVFFTNSGTEANEGALKFAQIFNNHVNNSFKTEQRKILAFQGSFHGRSLGALSVTYKPKIRLPFEKLLNKNVIHVPFNDVKAVKRIFEEELVSSVIVEPVQGEGGINPASLEFLQFLRDKCTEFSIPLIFDEVQIGFGRAGSNKVWGYELYDIVPDILTCAKPIAGGLPMGAILLSNSFISKLNEISGNETNPFLGLHGSTFAGNPVCSAAAEVVLKELSDSAFLEQIAKSGEILISELLKLQQEFPDLIVKVNRPVGDKSLYAGLKVTVPVDEFIRRALDQQLLILSAGDDNDIIRICPPLVIAPEEVREGVSVLTKVFANFEKEFPVLSPPISKAFDSQTEFDETLSLESSVPLGFSVFSSSFEFWPDELGGKKQAEMKLNLIKLDNPSSHYGAVFTTNKFPGAPVKVGRKLVEQNEPIGAILVNNKISNVNPRGGGIKDIETITNEAKSQFQLSHDTQVFPASTGIIGWRLPVEDIVQSLSTMSPSTGAEFAKGITTTDAYPKSCSREMFDKEGNRICRIVGFAKGAGMIEPNLATMLCFVLTDLDIKTLGFKRTLQEHIEEAVNVSNSLNSISIDSDQSTSDTVLLISSNAQNYKMISNFQLNFIEASFQKALQELCKELAEHIVRNGEGTEHVIKVTVQNCETKDLARKIGKQVINSPLVKTAIAGNDPNLGRILCAIGNALSNETVSKSMTIRIGDILVFESSEFRLDEDKENNLTSMFKNCSQDLKRDPFPTTNDCVNIVISLENGNETATVIGSDLTHGYVSENADYRS